MDFLRIKGGKKSGDWSLELCFDCLQSKMDIVYDILFDMINIKPSSLRIWEDKNNHFWSFAIVSAHFQSFIVFILSTFSSF